ncbi:MAG: hypothetical protein ACTSWZ_06025 [Candidatus Heimdallarchaeaceae archaeon]
METKYFIVLTLAIIGFILISGCIQQTGQLHEGKPLTETKQLSLSGPTWATVDDEVRFIIVNDGSPIEGINITAGGKSALTDKQGAVKFIFETDGDYELTTNTPGYTAKKVLFEDNFDNLEKWFFQPENDCKLLEEGYSLSPGDNKFLKVDYQGKMWIYPKPELVDKEAVAWRNYKISLRFKIIKGDLSLVFRNMHRGGSYKLHIEEHEISLNKF